MKTKFTSNQYIFIFIQKYKIYICYLLKQLYAFILTIYENIVQKFICMKNLFLGKRTCSSILK